MVELNIDYTGSLRCKAVHAPSGNTLLTDAPVDNKGKGETFSPSDLVATAFGACMATIMGIVAEEQKIDLTGTKVHVVKEMTSEPPRVIKRLTATIVIPAALSPEQKTMLESAAKTSPVALSLNPSIETPVKFEYPADPG